jgi:putative cell wall-binding protein
VYAVRPGRRAHGRTGSEGSSVGRAATGCPSASPDTADDRGPTTLRTTLRTLLAAALLAALLPTALAIPAAAQGGDGTILYVQGGDVWLTTPDGAQRHQVTTDGGWSSPSMADDGTIVAVQGRFDLVRMDAQGTVLSAFRPTPVFGQSGISDARVSADGLYVTYWSVELCNDPLTGALRGCFQQSIVFADGRQAEEVAGVVQNNHGTWLPGNQIALGQYGVDTLAPGDEDSTPWFRSDATLEGDSEDGPDDIGSISVDAAGELMAILARVYAYGPAEDGSQDESLVGIHFYELDGPPPAEPTRSDCFVPDQQGGRYFDTISLSPAGDGFVVESSTDEITVDETTTDLQVVRGFDPATCDVALTTLVQGAIDPSWSAAPFDPTGGGSGPTPPPPGGGSTPPAPDQPAVDLVDGGRVDGGGSADPVGQAIATSASIWADGGAALVVLATADRFPDALAGSALAGEQGPVLVTPFADALDPRVQAEIARVTGGDGIVLILGGTSAVSDGAAAQARTAAGTATCPAPFPTDCRYAGTGREHTAALVGQTVLELNDGSGGRALLARGDAFADAITGGAYAAEAGVPILLTPSAALDDTTRRFIADNGIGEVIVLGGTAAVSDTAAGAVPAQVRRIAGDDRTATAAAIATQLWQAEGLAGGGIIVVNVRHDDGWQTALAAAVLSALANAPQLGVENPPAGPSPATLAAASALGGPVETHGSAALVTDQQAQAIQQAAG